MQLSHNIPLILVSSLAWVVKANMSVTHTARIGKVAMFFDMQLSHNNIMQHCRYYSVHQLGKVGKDVCKSHA